ncbi:MAG: tripartite tricarboxylate transporter TctB family protein [Thermodesulfobacteriota bacterium]|nr:tripartite tricarboxylate transporter TctB family protein [Thermodesulfobacteriota bacterium]
MGRETRKEITSSLVFIVFGLGYLIHNTMYSMDTWNSPGPGVFPLIVGGALILLAACQLFQSLRKPKKRDDPKSDGLSIKSLKAFLQERGEAKPLILVVVFILYLLMVKWLGFFTSNSIFVVISSRLMGAKDWRKPVALAVGVGLFCYLLFEVWLKLSLPRGYLF